MKWFPLDRWDVLASIMAGAGLGAARAGFAESLAYLATVGLLVACRHMVPTDR